MRRDREPRRTGPLPLSFAQQRLWFVEQLAEPGLLTLPFALRLRGRLQVDALVRSFDAVIGRHEVLRTGFVASFVTAQGEPRQVIHPARPFELAVVDVADEALAAQLDTFLAARFDLTAPPLLRARLFRVGPEDHVLAVAVHHIVADGWSIALLVDELMAGYRAGGDLAGPAPGLQYADYAVWQRAHIAGPVWARQLAAWKQQLAGAGTVLRLSGARSEPPATRRAARVRRQLDAALTAGLAARAEQHGATLFMLLYAALAVVLRRRAAPALRVRAAPAEQSASRRLVRFGVTPPFRMASRTLQR